MEARVSLHVTSQHGKAWHRKQGVEKSISSLLFTFLPIEVDLSPTSRTSLNVTKHDGNEHAQIYHISRQASNRERVEAYAERFSCTQFLCCRCSLFPSQTPCRLCNYETAPTLPSFPTLVHPFILPLPFLSYRTEIPDRSVNILDAIFIEANSWKSNLAAYGI